MIISYTFLVTFDYSDRYHSCTCKYRNCRAEDDSAITSEASLRALDAFCSPSAAMTLRHTQKKTKVRKVGHTSSLKNDSFLEYFEIDGPAKKKSLKP